jgi:3-isopropylmalate/(R)-2-methylmalate dehydratase small subunit
VVEPEAHRRLLATPGAEICVDLRAGTVSLPDGGEARFEIERFARHCLLEGVDPIGYLLGKEAEIHAYEENSPWTQ